MAEKQDKELTLEELRDQKAITGFQYRTLETIKRKAESKQRDKKTVEEILDSFAQIIRNTKTVQARTEITEEETAQASLAADIAEKILENHPEIKGAIDETRNRASNIMDDKFYDETMTAAAVSMIAS